MTQHFNARGKQRHAYLRSLSRRFGDARAGWIFKSGMMFNHITGQRMPR